MGKIDPKCRITYMYINNNEIKQIIFVFIKYIITLLDSE